MTFSREQKIETVIASPKAVAAKDAIAWASIFAKYNVVEDPVGSAPHHNGVFDAKAGRRGNGALGRFFETFIAPNEITFHVDQDIVCDNHVCRDLTIEIQMAPAVVVKVPMHLLYELCDENGQPRIQRLAAHWELWPMIKQLFAVGPAAYSVLMALGMRMMRIQGLSGALGFSKGFLGIGAIGKKRVENFVAAFNEHSTAKIADQFDPNGGGLFLPHGSPAMNPIDAADLEDCSLSATKLLVAGYSVSATISFTQGENTYQGIGIFEFNSKTKFIDTARLYWEQ